jgi:hypothetical protein
MVWEFNQPWSIDEIEIGDRLRGDAIGGVKRVWPVCSTPAPGLKAAPDTRGERPGTRPTGPKYSTGAKCNATGFKNHRLLPNAGVAQTQVRRSRKFEQLR